MTVAIDADRLAHRRLVVAGSFEELVVQGDVFAGARFVNGAESLPA